MKKITIPEVDVTCVDIAIKESEQSLAEVRMVAIIDQPSYENVSNIRKIANSRIKALEEVRRGITVPIDTAKKKIMDLFRGPTAAYEQVVSICDKGMIAWIDKQERIRQEQERKLQAESEKKRRELEAKAEAARAAGKEEKAERYEVKAAEVIAPVLAPTVEQIKGVHFTERWYADVLDFKALPDDYKLPDMVKLNKMAQAVKGTITIPGVTFRKEKIVNSRS